MYLLWQSVLADDKLMFLRYNTRIEKVWYQAGVGFTAGMWSGSWGTHIPGLIVLFSSTAYTILDASDGCTDDSGNYIGAVMCGKSVLSSVIGECAPVGSYQQAVGWYGTGTTKRSEIFTAPRVR
jgi:hypothetical protein